MATHVSANDARVMWGNEQAVPVGDFTDYARHNRPTLTPIQTDQYYTNGNVMRARLKKIRGKRLRFFALIREPFFAQKTNGFSLINGFPI